MTVILTLALAIGVSAAPVELKSGTRQLSTTELKKRIVGHDMQRVVPPELLWLEGAERFRKDGTYTKFVHRDDDQGTYRIEGDAVCVTLAERPELCRFIFVDRNRRYWISTLKSTRDFIQIEFVPLAD